ncbi:5-formyltetrahydrofolate cyclo-ligase [Beutenbergia cavernae DSM 12333]|uniref:5-formyltetrahydrofolate cyclo-ligase n=1 Tax=Beutenbergia cavernae (strain ATCC BAA-8 / DSM 12333 / CCUG 43141 / JCM 11478 / NBRC 16432 / NCIMB 13614 / HKI 0122) TaxID=471853 RepID=C5BZJ3_BEUC1|nr:5-formyltetrahydrofolate cyclo-ligase [Beutenbergia cavernae]ACQ79165.1 5-formyltetrahydrofolate cyclo-ligase [Beutenbergia cavernae DSM 12333]
MSSAANFTAGPHGAERTKDQLRVEARARRTGRSSKARVSAAAGIADRAAELLEARADGVTCVAAYASRPAEPGTAPLLDLLDQRGVRVLLPVLGPGLARGWAEYADADDLAVRAPGRPPEPSGPASEAEALGAAAVVFAPALGVDDAGIRLGQGGGWYDRALHHAAPDALVVAVVFDDEVHDDALPREEHDVPVHAVLTPSSWWLVPR